MFRRLWIYQRERFPLLAHGPLVAVFCLSVLLFSALQTASTELPSQAQIVGAIVTALLLFFQLRVADEFKDHDDDVRFRPHRPVPRGLVSLRELAALAAGAAVVQFCIALSLDVGLVPLLGGVWLYLWLMTREFFAPAWLKRHPTAYLLSHMLIMPIIAFYISAFDWLCVGRTVPAGLGWLLSVSFFTGLGLELGRKIKAPPNERPGVETYSGLWGVPTSLAVWFGCVSAAAVAALAALKFLGGGPGLMLVAIGTPVVAAVCAAPLLLQAGRRAADAAIEPASGVAALLIYLCLGPAQFLMGV